MFIVIFGKFFSIIAFPDSTLFWQKENFFKWSQRIHWRNIVANRNNLMKIEFLLRTPGLQKKWCYQNWNRRWNVFQHHPPRRTPKIVFRFRQSLWFSVSKIPDSNGKTYCLKATLQKNSSSKFIRFLWWKIKTLNSHSRIWAILTARQANLFLCG